MPDYAAQWLAVWGPYAQFGRQHADAGIRALVEGMEQDIKLTGNLRLLNVFYGEVENYRKACQDLRRQPGNQSLHIEEQRLRRNVLTVQGNFLEHATVAIQLCADVPRLFGASRQLIKQNPQHMALVSAILAEISKISNGLTTERDEYGPRIQVTLDNMRRNA